MIRTDSFQIGSVIFFITTLFLLYICSISSWLWIRLFCSIYLGSGSSQTETGSETLVSSIGYPQHWINIGASYAPQFCGCGFGPSAQHISFISPEESDSALLKPDPKLLFLLSAIHNTGLIQEHHMHHKFVVVDSALLLNIPCFFPEESDPVFLNRIRNSLFLLSVIISTTVD